MEGLISMEVDGEEIEGLLKIGVEDLYGWGVLVGYME